ncbi:MAG: hypothetical protein UY41_C0042G0001, partial [Candidatus Moranbacteria bacterium GW2011_GWE1_49_15]
MPHKKIPMTFFLLTAMLFFSISPATAATKNELKIKNIPFKKTTENEKYEDGEILIKYKKSKINLNEKSGKDKANVLEISKGLQKIRDLENLNIRLVKTNGSVEESLSELKKKDEIEIAEPNYARNPLLIPNDTYFGFQWGPHNTGQTLEIGNPLVQYTGSADADIDAPEAWDGESVLNSEVTVAVIDTGARLTHEDLSANIWANPEEIADNGLDDDSNGYIDDMRGWDFNDNDNNPNDAQFLVGSDDISGHGTFISGIIGGASGNGRGISGISSKNKIKVMPLRFDLYLSSELEAIDYAKNNGAKVINASFGSLYFSQLEKDAIDSFPGLFVAAAGNEGVDNDSTPQYPCSLSSSNIICVASSDQNDNLSSFSNYGASSVDIAAPGENIASIYNDADNSYVYGDGTSFASPFIASSAAMLWSKNPSYSVSEVKNKLISTGDNMKSCVEAGRISSGKRLNLKNLLDDSHILISSSVCTPAYRFYNPRNGDRLITTSESEKTKVLNMSDWKYEGIMFY